MGAKNAVVILALVFAAGCSKPTCNDAIRDLSIAVVAGKTDEDVGKCHTDECCSPVHDKKFAAAYETARDVCPPTGWGEINEMAKLRKFFKKGCK